MKPCRFALLVLVLLVPRVQAQPDSLTGAGIAEMVHDRPDGDDRTMTMTMTLINHRGAKRVRSTVSYSKDYGEDSKSVICFLEPADVRGTGFLTWDYDDPAKEDDRWLYMPALGKVRRIAGSSRNDYFMGTDFTYQDLGSRAVGDDEHELLREEEFDGFQCWVVESKPKEEGHMYSRVVKWVRQDALIPVRVEFYDRTERLLKILTVPDIRFQDGFWTAFHMEMESVQDKHRTMLEMSDVEYNPGLSDNLFRVSTLEQGRVK